MKLNWKCGQDLKELSGCHLHILPHPLLLWWQWRSCQDRPDTPWHQNQAGSGPAGRTRRSPVHSESDCQAYIALETHQKQHSGNSIHTNWTIAQTAWSYLCTQRGCGSAGRPWRFPRGRNYTPADPLDPGRSRSSNSRTRYVPERSRSPPDTGLHWWFKHTAT